MPQMGRRDSADAQRFRGLGRAATVAFTLVVALALIPGVAHATPTLTVTSSFPSAVTVGATADASFTLTNNSTFEDPSFVLCKAGDGGACAGSEGIILIPSCGQDSGNTCLPSGVDRGVFSISQLATGGAGTRCAGVSFLTSTVDPTFGKVRFTPTGGIDVGLSIGESCRVEFTVTATRLPSLDARPAAGIQTASIVTASARTYLSAPLAGGGSSVTTVTPGAPATPTGLDVDPNSPSSDNTPEVKGSAPAGTTVSVYTDAACGGAAAAQGPAAAFAAPGLTATVADNSTTTFYAAVTDPATGLRSGCSAASAPYAEDSAAPQTTIGSGPSGATDEDQPVFTFTSDDPGSGFSCRVDTTPFAPCISPFQTAQLTSGAHTFEVRAIDGVGNVDPTPASRTFTVGTTFTPSGLSGCSLRGNNVTGTPDDDTLSGTARTDILVGLSASDVLRGLGGRDCLFGQGGTDRLFGGAGADLLFGGADNDTLNGDAGNDRLSGDAGLDRIDGGAGNDNMLGGSGPDRFTDRRGTDRFSGGAGNDRVNSRDTSPVDRRGRDRVACGPGRDTVLADRRDIVSRDCEVVLKR